MIASSITAAEPQVSRSSDPEHGDEIECLASSIRDACLKLASQPGHAEIEDELVPWLERAVLLSPSDLDFVRGVLDRLGPELLLTAQLAYESWETRLEQKFAEGVLAGSMGLSAYLLYERFRKLLKRELSLLPAEPKNVLFIGSGPVPISALLVHDLTGAKVTCIDQNPQAVAVSRKLIAEMGFERSISVYETLGQEVVADKYDVVLVALLAKPKADILANIHRSIRPDGYVLCRTSRGLRQLLYESTAVAFAPLYEVVAEQIADGDLTISTLLLRGHKARAGAERGAKMKGGPAVRFEWTDEIDGQTQDQLAHLINEILDADGSTIGYPGRLSQAEARSVVSDWRELVESGRSHLLVGRRGAGDIVGTVILTPDTLPNCRHRAYISKAMIAPPAREIPVLLDGCRAVVRKCDELNVEMLLLDVRAGTTIERLWRLLGFAEAGRLPDYAREGDQRFDGLFLYQTVEDMKRRVLYNGGARRASPVRS